MREMMRRLAALIVTLAAALALAVGGTAAYAAGTGTITVTPPSDTQAGEQTTYRLYKVFVARGNGTGISYNTVNVGDEIKSGDTTLLHSKGWTVPDVSRYVTDYNATTTPHFILDQTGNVHWGTLREGASYYPADDQVPANSAYSTSDIIDSNATNLPDYAVQAIADYIREDSPIDTKTATGTGSVTFDNVSNGYYYVSTTSGTLVAVNSANPNASITDKNVTPTLDKVITAVSRPSGAATEGTTSAVGSVESGGKRAIAELGSNVTYQVTVRFNSGASNVKLHDTLDNTLTLVSQDPTVTFYNENNTEVTVGDAYVARYNKDGTTGTVDDPDSGDTITIDFTGNSAASVSYATVTYAATVRSGQLTSANPAKNSAYLSYGTNEPQAKTAKVDTSVYNANYQVTKVDNANQPLAGAGFVLRKTETVGGTTATYYYKLNTATDGTQSVSWVRVPANTQTPELAVRSAADNGTITRLTTQNGPDGNVLTFEGLSDGTYELYEVDVPEGYRRADNTSFTVRAATDGTTDTDGNVIAFTDANLKQTGTVQNNPGSALPVTGGMGTALLYAVGAALVAGGIALAAVRRRRTA